MGNPRQGTRNRLQPNQDSPVFTKQEDGLVPAPTVIANKFLRDDGTWRSVSGGVGGDIPTGTGFVHVTDGEQDAVAQLVDNVDVSASAGIVESKLALNFPTHSNANDPTSGQKLALTGTAGTPGASNQYVTDADVRLNVFTNTQPGLVPNPGTTASKFLRDDGTWQVVAAGNHASTHQNSGADEINVAGLSGELADAQKLNVRAENISIGTRSKLNFIEGTNVTLSVIDDAINAKVDVTINATGGSGTGNSYFPGGW